MFEDGQTRTRGQEAELRSRVLDGAIQIGGSLDGKRVDVSLRNVSFPLIPSALSCILRPSLPRAASKISTGTVETPLNGEKVESCSRRMDAGIKLCATWPLDIWRPPLPATYTFRGPPSVHADDEA